MNILNRINNAESGFKTPGNPIIRTTDSKPKTKWWRIIIGIGVAFLIGLSIFLIYRNCI